MQNQNQQPSLSLPQVLAHLHSGLAAYKIVVHNLTLTKSCGSCDTIKLEVKLDPQLKLPAQGTVYPFAEWIIKHGSLSNEPFEIAPGEKWYAKGVSIEYKGPSECFMSVDLMRPWVVRPPIPAPWVNIVVDPNLEPGKVVLLPGTKKTAHAEVLEREYRQQILGEFAPEEDEWKGINRGVDPHHMAGETPSTMFLSPNKYNELVNELSTIDMSGRPLTEADMKEAMELIANEHMRTPEGTPGHVVKWDSLSGVEPPLTHKKIPLEDLQYCEEYLRMPGETDDGFRHRIRTMLRIKGLPRKEHPKKKDPPHREHAFWELTPAKKR